MAQVPDVVRQKVLRLYDSVRDLFPIRKVLLYGSYAKGRASADSDIDVAVVIDESDHSRRVEITAKLYHHAADVDVAIEPKCIFWDEYQNHDPASILSEIISTSIEVV